MLLAGHVDLARHILKVTLREPLLREKASGRDNGGFTPSEIARVNGHGECSVLLAGYGS